MEENKLILFLSRHWSKCLLAVLLLASGTMVGVRLFNSKFGNHKQDFVVANQIYESFKKGEPLANEAIDVTEKILKRHPELHARYNSPLALTFLIINNVAKGKEYAQMTLARVNERLPLCYSTYANVTLLIAEEKYAEALSLAKNLEESVRGKKEYEMLDGLNLLRLVFLAEKNHQPDLRQRFWLAFKQHSSYPTIASMFHEGSLTLIDFIEKDESLSET